MRCIAANNRSEGNNRITKGSQMFSGNGQFPGARDFDQSDVFMRAAVLFQRVQSAALELLGNETIETANYDANAESDGIKRPLKGFVRHS